MNRGVLYATGAYFIWGLLPIFWKTLAAVPPIEILGHRMVWSFLCVSALLTIRRRWAWLSHLREPRTAATFLLTASLLSLNWLIYIWAVNAGFIVEASLGYFINPLVNVLLGYVVLGERLRPGQKVAIGLALVGVLYLTLSVGGLPWIALTLASTFGLYGLLRKTARLDSLEGLSTETGLMALPALALLLYLAASGRGVFGGDAGLSVLLLVSGLVTAIPLLLFAAGARRVTMTTLGLLQYIAPTMQFLIGIYVYGETLPTARLAGYALIWIALGIYSAEGIARSRRALPTPRPVAAP